MSTKDPNTSIFETDLDKVTANHAPLTPINFLTRSAAVYPDQTAVIHGDRRFSYREFEQRCRRLASALAGRGVGRGDTVAVMATNIPALLEAHYGVPMLGAVLNAINTRLDAPTVAFILEHGGAKVVLSDRELSEIMKAAVAAMADPPLVVDIDDVLAESGELIGEIEYEAFLAEGDPAWDAIDVTDEWQAISLNYTSGTTGNPKGVVYHHRGAYLNALGQIVAFQLNTDTVYLWTLPMFHCNGWCFPWAVIAAGGTHVCLRKVDPALIFPAIAEHTVSHMCGAPIVLTAMIHAPEGQKRAFNHTIEIATGGAAPPSAVIAGMEEMGFRVTHLYGLTEVYGPATLCAKQRDWDALPAEERVLKNARQGVRYPTLEGCMVADPETLEPVPPDGETVAQGQHGDEGLPQERWRHRRGLRWRLVPQRRSGGGARGRLHRGQGPLQGHHHLGRREHLEPRGRRSALPPRRSYGSGGGGAAGPEMGRDALRFRHPEARCGAGQRGGYHRLLPRQHGPFQGTQDGGIRPLAQDLDGKDPEIRAARARGRALEGRTPCPMISRPHSISRASRRSSPAPRAASAAASP
jgi:fatty-acyl-CoA synthase